MGGEWRSRRGAVRDGCNDMVMAQIEAAMKKEYSGQEEYGRRTRPRPRRNVQRRNIAPTQAVAYCYWQGPMCRHVVLDFVQGKERWSCSIGLEASLGWPRRSSLGFRWIAENEI
ncbi:Hypothetical predicted protein [Olea europaea subsp. europaea]|uniref:Uncharacterized protein n=1 Tax=Olea europaea subsp. europaea TaxID=158383 RepID=A0A8S0T1G8_OLEEU|nr:Hypothetical predicted protein [Olea europaea subsp. europaea]